VGDAVLLLATGFLPAAEAKSVIVKCGKGTISKVLSNTGPLTVVVQGICTENVIITGDDVTLKGDPGATVIAAPKSDGRGGVKRPKEFKQQT
jgi:hypothetical protein